MAKIAASMAEFGWTVPVLVAADGELIAGHGRILAAARLGLTEAPVIVLGHLTEAQRRAYRIADNKLTELGGWDDALLLQELQALLAEDFDLGLIGILEDELDALLADADDRPAVFDDAADAIPAPPAEPITKPGDIWALGRHRLCCGDATDPAAVARLMQNEAATLMFTSPPYAQQRDYGVAKEKVGDWDALMQGVFAAAPVTTDAQVLVIIEQFEGALNVLPSVPLGAPATVASREGRSMRSFGLPWIPHDDVILASDIQGVPAFGGNENDQLATVMLRKLTLMCRKHAQTREYMEMNALRGIVKDGAGTTLYNYFTEFGLGQISVDFLLGTATTKVQEKVREAIRAVEDNLLGESMISIYALVSPEFFDKLIGHALTQDAYKFYAATGAQPLRQDVRRSFPFAGILFEEYRGTVTLSTGAAERLIPAGEGVAFPIGTIDTFTTYGGPANQISLANTIGLPLYARQLMDEKDRWINILTEASILPVNKRPRTAIRLFSSN